MQDYKVQGKSDTVSKSQLTNSPKKDRLLIIIIIKLSFLTYFPSPLGGEGETRVRGRK